MVRRFLKYLWFKHQPGLIKCNCILILLCKNMNQSYLCSVSMIDNLLKVLWWCKEPEWRWLSVGWLKWLIYMRVQIAILFLVHFHISAKLSSEWEGWGISLDLFPLTLFWLLFQKFRYPFELGVWSLFKNSLIDYLMQENMLNCPATN